MNQSFTSGTVNIPLIQSTGGLNTTASPLSVADNESTDLKNINIDQWGAISKRNGYLNLNASAVNSSAVGNGIYYAESSSAEYLVSVFGNKFYKMDDLDGTFDDVTGTITLTAGQNNQCQFKTYNDTLFGTNNVNAPFKWAFTGNAAAMDVPADLTRAKCIEIFTEYAFLANVTVDGVDYKSRLYWSAVGDPTTWNSADWININKNDGTEITVLKTLGDKLVVFKKRSIYIGIFTGDTDVPFVFVKTPSHVGCIARDSVQEIGNGLVFLSYDGFYYFDGSNSTKISDKINYTFKNSISASRLKYAQSTVYKSRNQYVCFLTPSGGSKNTYGLIWDYYSKAWLRWEGYINSTTKQDINSITTIYYNDEERPYFVDSAGFGYRMDTGTNDYPLGTLTAIYSYYKTKWFNFEDIINQKAIPHIMVYPSYSAATLSVGYSYDFEQANQYTLTIPLSSSSSSYGSSVYGTATYAGEGGFPYRLDLKGRGRVFRLSFENNAASEQFTINGFGISVYMDTSR